MRNKLLPVVIAIFGILSCKQEQKKTDQTFEVIDYDETGLTNDEKELFTKLDSTSTGITFSNPITESEQINIVTYEYLHNGGGVAAGDINNDGLIDLYFTGNMVPNKLYLNEGNFKFRDITASTGTDGGMGFKTGVTMADVNNDGWLDIYVCKSMLSDPQYRRNILYINNGDLTFTEKASEFGIDDASFSTQGYFFDMDTDGDLDLFLLNHPFNFLEGNNLNVAYNTEAKLEVVKTTDLTYISDRLYENENGRFTDITKKAGLEDDGFGLSAVIADFNNDLKPDIYVCNDYIQPDYLYINKGNNSFTDKFSDYFAHSSFSSMGSDYADINNDGCPDLMTLDMLPRDHYRQNMLAMLQNFDKFEKMTGFGLKAQYSINTLQLNNCNGKFSDIAFMSNTAYTDWSWSTLMADFDNDGWKDIYVSNGCKRDITNNDYIRYRLDSLRKELNQKKITLKDWVGIIPSVKTQSFLFRNNRNLSFSDVSTQWNSGPPAFSNGSAYADLNNDGYLDIIVNRVDEPALILKNDGKASRANNFIRFMLKTQKEPVQGTQVKLFQTDGKFQVQQFNPTRGFLSSVEPVLHFGIGKATQIDKVELVWPDGTVQVIEKPEINKTHHVDKTNSNSKYQAAVNKNLFFEDVSSKLPSDLVHQENPYIDFKREPLLHHKYSEEGPATATADVNNDGLDDVFIGGAEGYPGKLLLQKKNGGFKINEINIFEQDKLYEDVAAIFFDANGDSFNDLIVISGGNEKPLNAPEYQHRLYLNNGKGDFTKSDGNLQGIRSSGSCVAVSDIDGDGDLDAFIGGRLTPGQYPLPPVSYLLRNDKGIFKDITSEWSEELSNIGMITDAKFADLDKDGIKELVLAGEWMPVTIFKKINKKYINITSTLGISDKTGWWYSLEIADLNNDGFPEILAGNLGLNSHITSSGKKPASLYYKDFDNNGTIDPMLCFYSSEKNYPLHFRDRVLDHMVVLKKKFTRYHLYANASIDDVFSKDQFKDATILYANTFAHTLFVNNSGKSFAATALPRHTQISAVRSIKAFDINNDSYLDLVIGGNLYNTDAQIGRYDASIGAVLLGNGKLGFQIIGPTYSGFCIPGNVRNLLLIKSGNTINSIMAVRNNDKCSLFEIK